MLTLVREAGRSRDGHKLGEFACSCGGVTVVAISRVKNGYTRSCGCLSKETKPNLIHGMRGTPTYTSWIAMKRRTTDPRDKDYPRYGGAGIGMCEQWKDFTRFLADMGERPPGTTIDRIDGMRGYEPNNCRWATPTQQARNTRVFVIVQTPIGVMPLIDYADRINISTGAAHMRLKRGKLEGCSYAAKN